MMLFARSDSVMQERESAAGENAGHEGEEREFVRAVSHGGT
jgi:hypothetical protein